MKWCRALLVEVKKRNWRRDEKKRKERPKRRCGTSPEGGEWTAKEKLGWWIVSNYSVPPTRRRESKQPISIFISRFIEIYTSPLFLPPLRRLFSSPFRAALPSFSTAFDFLLRVLQHLRENQPEGKGRVGKMKYSNSRMLCPWCQVPAPAPCASKAKETR